MASSRCAGSLEAVADHLASVFEAGTAPRGSLEASPISNDLAELLDTVFLANAPYAHRLLRLVEDRGWTGWTMVRRIPGHH